MHRAYDYNGVVVAESRPKKILTRVKKTIHIDSGDRDQVKYYTNGDFVIYLPRTYQQVVSIRLKDAQFPPIVPGTKLGVVSASGSTTLTVTVSSTAGLAVGQTIIVSGITGTTVGYNGTFAIASVPSATTFTYANPSAAGSPTYTNAFVTIGSGAATHLYEKGPNTALAKYDVDTVQTTAPSYFLIGLEGLNKTDETTVGANRSTYSDSFFAKIPATASNYGGSTFINYNDHSAIENIATYSPPVENLDRLRITVRTHAQQDKSGFLYWTSDGAVASTGNRGAEFNLTLEVEYLENTFDDFSTYETRLSDR
jgi:hypothetical protein